MPCQNTALLLGGALPGLLSSHGEWQQHQQWCNAFRPDTRVHAYAHSNAPRPHIQAVPKDRVAGCDGAPSYGRACVRGVCAGCVCGGTAYPHPMPIQTRCGSLLHFCFAAVHERQRTNTRRHNPPEAAAHLPGPEQCTVYRGPSAMNRLS